MAKRYTVDCRKHPSATNCSLQITGTEDEVLDTAVAHAVNRHGHANTPELRMQLRGILEEVSA
jgi:hypothetical protein